MVTAARSPPLGHAQVTDSQSSASEMDVSDQYLTVNAAGDADLMPGRNTGRLAVRQDSLSTNNLPGVSRLPQPIQPNGNFTPFTTSPNAYATTANTFYPYRRDNALAPLGTPTQIQTQQQQPHNHQLPQLSAPFPTSATFLPNVSDLGTHSAHGAPPDTFSQPMAIPFMPAGTVPTSIAPNMVGGGSFSSLSSFGSHVSDLSSVLSNSPPNSSGNMSASIFGAPHDLHGHRSVFDSHRHSTTSLRSDDGDDDLVDVDDGPGGPTSASIRHHSRLSASSRTEAIRMSRIRSEQKRRNDLRDGFDRLRDILPPTHQKSSKNALLERAILQINTLSTANSFLIKEVEQIKKENEDLRRTNNRLVETVTQNQYAQQRGLHDQQHKLQQRR